jgi:hypothetical protein
VTKARRPRASTKLIRVRSRVIDSTRGLSMIRRREFPSVQALVTSISPTGRMVIELSICSVSTESRFGAVADSSSKVGSRARVRPAQWSRLVLPTDYYPGRQPTSSQIPDARKRRVYPREQDRAAGNRRPRLCPPSSSGGSPESLGRLDLPAARFRRPTIPDR